MALSLHKPRLQRSSTTKLAYPDWRRAFSAESMHRAWLSVRANKGAAAGDETIAQFEQRLDHNLGRMRRELIDQTYHPQPVKQILVPKPDDRWRPITLWTIRDRIAQRAVYNYLEPLWETQFLPCSHGFRTGFSTQTAANAIQDARKRGLTWVFDADIKDCFGSMNDRVIHKRLQAWQTPAAIQRLISAWLQAQIHNAWRGRTTAGTSQGGVISPLLCNLYLHSLDSAMHKRNWQIIRYADDFVVCAASERALRSAQRHAEHTLKQLALQIHPQKTRVTTFERGFQFVGWFFIRDEMYKLKG